MLLSTSDPFVLYENDAIMVINKPSGLHSVKISEGGGSSCADILLSLYPDLSTVSNKPEDCGICNRLDHMTSGLLFAAKTRTAWEFLRTAFQDHRIDKTYLCFVEGCLREERVVDGFITTRYRRSKKVQFIDIQSSATQPPRAQKVSSHFSSQHIFNNEQISLVQVKTTTGARHQVRVSASSLGHPLVGDTLYGSKHLFSKRLSVTHEIDLFLHAWQCTVPANKLMPCSFSAPLPQWFVERFPEIRLNEAE
jgi:23S rRNA-/tRNA-specific pseudouridylate synthase